MILVFGPPSMSCRHLFFLPFVLTLAVFTIPAWGAPPCSDENCITWPQEMSFSDASDTDTASPAPGAAEVVDYGDLLVSCDKEADPTCCRNSVESMKLAGAVPLPHGVTACPSAAKLKDLNCQGSFTWCETE